MTFSTTTLTTTPRVHAGVILLASTSSQIAKRKGQTAPAAKPPRSPPALAHLSKGRPPRSRLTDKDTQPHTRPQITRRPAYTRTPGKTVRRGYDRPQTTRVARAIDNAEKRITALLFDPAHALSKRPRPASSDRPTLPRIEENELYPRPPPTAMHPMVRTKALRPRLRSPPAVQDENQPPISKSTPPHPLHLKEGRARAVAYSISREPLARRAVS